MKKLLTLGLLIIMLGMLIIPVVASDAVITPYYNNTMRATARFNIDETGNSSMTLMYTGYPTYAIGATIDTKIQKLVSNDWVDVTGASWTDEIEGIRGTVNRNHQLSSTGTYRLVYEFEIRGTGGEADVISGSIEATY